MARQYLDRMGFAGGVKPSYSAVATPKTAIWEARNVDVDDVGVLGIRPGSRLEYKTSALLVPGSIKGILPVFDTVLGVWRQTLHKWDGVGWSVVTASNLLADTDVSMEVWSEAGAEIAYLHDGAGLWKITTSGVALVIPYEPQSGEEANLLRDTDGTQDLTSGPAKGRIALFRHGLSSRMAIAHDNTVYLSAPDNPAYFPFNQMFRLPDDGGHIVSLVMAYGALLIFRDTDVWAFYGSSVTDTGAWLKRQSRIGCVAPGSIQEVPGMGIVYLGPDNIYALQGVSGIEDQYQSVPIGDDIVKYLKFDSNAASVYYNREYILSFPTAPEPERVFRFKPTSSSWYIDNGPRAEHFFVKDNHLHFTQRGIIYQYSKEFLSDDGTGITFESTFSQERLSQGPAKLRKIFLYAIATETVQKLQLTVTSGGKTVDSTELKMTVPGSQAFKIGVSRLGVGYLGRYDEVQIYEGHIRLSKGSFFQVTVSGMSAGQKIAILGYTLEYSPKQKMKGIKIKR